MNFDELEKDIEDLERSAKELAITGDKTFESAKHFSQACSNINLMLDKLQKSLIASNKLVCKKLDEYERKRPSPNEPEKQKTPTPAKVHIPEPSRNPGASDSPAPSKPAFSLDDFDSGPVSEEDELTAELQKTLF